MDLIVLDAFVNIFPPLLALSYFSINELELLCIYIGFCALVCPKLELQIHFLLRSSSLELQFTNLDPVSSHLYSYLLHYGLWLFFSLLPVVNCFICLFFLELCIVICPVFCVFLLC